MDPLTLIGMVPTAMNTVNSLSSLFQQPYQPQKIYQENSREVFKQGGKIRGHNNYNAPSHTEGGQMVNDQGVPSPNGRNEVEKNESKYTYSNIKNSSYIFTPEDAQKLSKLTKKYSKANTSQLEKNALELEIQRIENNNEMKKKKLTNRKYKYGGNPGDPQYPIVGLGAGVSELMKAMNPTGYLNQPMDYQSNKGKISNGRGDTLIDPLQTIDPRSQLLGGKVARLPSKQYTPVSTTPSMSAIDLARQTTSNPPNVSTTPVIPSSNNPLKNLDTLRNLTLAGSSLGLLKGAEKENPIMTNYSSARSEFNKLSNNLDPLKEQVAQSSNQLRNVNRNSASSYNTFANREAQRVGNLQQSLQNINLQERQLGNQIAGQKANFETNVARDNKQTLQQNRVNNQQNQAVSDRIKSEITGDVMSELDRKSTIINNANIATATRAEGMSLMSSMFSNFKPGDYSVVQKVATSGYESLTPEEKNKFDNLQTVQFKSE